MSITVFVLLVLEIPLGFAYAQSERRRFTAAVQHDALALSVRAEEAVQGGDPGTLQRLIDAYGRETDARVVVVDRNGELVADSDPTRAGARNFASRPELRAALAGNENSGTRRSDTLDQNLLYFAVPVVDGSTVVGAIRVTHPTSFLDARIRRTWLVLLGVGAIVLAVVFLVSLRLARQVTKPLDDLERAAAELGRGELESRAPVPDGPPEIRALAESFNRTAARLQDLVTSQQSFVADASHQLRTPLAALRLRLENLESELDRGDGDESAREDAAGALTEVARLSRLVDGLLELARAERATGNPEPVPVAGVVAGRVDARGPRWRGSATSSWSVRSTTASSSAPSPAAWSRSSTTSSRTRSRSRLRRAAVTVAARRVADGVEVSVADAGPGMTEDQRLRAFDRFWRPTGADRDGGSGLGLAIVQRLVTADNGTVSLHQPPQGGLAVQVLLPPA